LEQRQRAAVLQLSVAYETLVFQIVHVDGVPHALRDFLGDENIRLCGVSTDNDVKILSYYDIIIPGGARPPAGDS
jgi:hypothetical protein